MILEARKNDKLSYGHLRGFGLLPEPVLPLESFGGLGSLEWKPRAVDAFRAMLVVKSPPCFHRNLFT